MIVRLFLLFAVLQSSLHRLGQVGLLEFDQNAGHVITSRAVAFGIRGQAMVEKLSRNRVKHKFPTKNSTTQPALTSSQIVFSGISLFSRSLIKSTTS